MSDQAEKPGHEQPETPEEPGRGGDRGNGSAPEGHTDEDVVERLEAALAETEQELAARQDAMLRLQAEMENLRKRLIRDQERSRKFALERVMNDLLPVRDSLEKGLEADAGTATVTALLEGKALILKMFDKALEEHGLQVIDPVGEPFDPDWHEAMTMQPSEDFGEDTVMEVLQKGYRLHDRLLRPARVVVSRGPSTD